MTSEDITFCSKSDCRNTKCVRNQKNIKQHWLDHSYAMFTDCIYFNRSKDVDPDLWEEEMMYDARRYLTESGEE